MTTVPGHNQILQQSGIAQELSHQAHTLKPSPDQAAAQQQTQEVIRNSTVQGSEEAERLKKQKEKKELRQGQKAGRKKKRGINQEEDLALDPDAPGRLLDTRV
jgi:hypothetical protein